MHIFYNTNTGELICRIMCPDEDLQANIDNQGEGYGVFPYYPSDDDSIIETHYYDLANTILPRPLITSEPNKLILYADSVDSVILLGLPVPCTVKAGNDIHQLDDPEDTTFEFTTDTVGTFTVTVEQFPYITKSWEIEAV
jgi:hypothetical protein